MNGSITKNDNILSFVCTEKYSKSLSMDELSCLARKICSPISTIEEFFEEKSEFLFTSTGESSTSKRSEERSNYHSWPKKSTRRRTRKCTCRERKIGFINEKRTESSIRPYEQRITDSPHDSRQRNRDFESIYDQESCKFSVNPFYGGDSTIANQRELNKHGPNVEEVIRRQIINRQCHCNHSNKGKKLLPPETDGETASEVSESRILPRNRSQRLDRKKVSSFEIEAKLDTIERHEEKEDNTWPTTNENVSTGRLPNGVCHGIYRDLSQKSIEARSDCSINGNRENLYGLNQKVKNELQETTEIANKAFNSGYGQCNLERLGCVLNELEISKEAEFIGASSALQDLSLRNGKGQQNECSVKVGDAIAIKIKQSAICSGHLNGSNTEESSESSDSGVGNIRYDIIHRNWNEPTVSGPLFKKRLEILKQWYIQFDDDQRNIILKMLLENSQLPQMHMLSEIMEPALHRGCPLNCQDLLTWLPSSIIHCILKFLDPVSLAHASEVNKTWYEHCKDGRLWKRFCFFPDMQLSPAREREQILKYTNQDGVVQWKKVFTLRYCLRRNWLNGKCKIRTFTGHTQAVFCVQFDESRIVSGSSDKTIKVWDIKDGRTDPVLTLVGHSGAVRCLHLNGNRLISGSADATIKVWDLVKGRDWSSAACKVTMVGHVKIVRCLQVDDVKIVSGSYDRTLKLWDIKTGLCKTTFRGHLAPVLCVQFDDEKIVSGSADKTIKVWSMKSRSCLATIAGHTEAVTCLQFNVERIFSGSLDCSLKFWDLCTSQCIGTIDWIRSEGHTRVVRCLQADSWKIVSAGDDKALKIWSLETGKRFFTLRNHTDGVTCLQFNDHMLVSGSYDKSVKVWDFSPSDDMM